MVIRESYIFYASFYEAMKYLPDADYVAVSKAINEYALYGNEIELSGIGQAFFQLIKPQLDANNRRRDAGLKGGAPRGNNNATKQPKVNFETTETAETKQPKLNFETTETEQKNNLNQPNYNVNDNENDNVNGLGGDFDFAAADAATQTEDGVSANPIENSASPKEEKGCGEKEERPTATPTIEDRKQQFRQKVNQIAQDKNYPAAIVDDFCRYWLEMNEGGKKMRFETEKYFQHESRLVTWIKNEEKWEAQRRPASRPTAAQSPSASNSVDDIWNNR